MKLDKESEFKKKWRKWWPRLLVLVIVLALLVAAGLMFDWNKQIEHATQNGGKYSKLAEWIQQAGWIRSLLIFAFIVALFWAVYEEQNAKKRG